MDDSQLTRFVRLRADVDRRSGRNDETLCVGTRTHERVRLVDHRGLFNQHQRRLSQLLHDYPKPGIAVFGLHWSAGIAGHFWLAATERLRAGTIGRHSAVDLFLRDDDELSLRHLLVLVKARQDGLRVRFADLATPGGFQAEEGGVLRGVDANGTVILRAATYSLFAFPTGVPVPWNVDVADPWSTLPARVLLTEPREQLLTRARPLELRPGDTSLAFCEGPFEPGPAPLLRVGEELEGHLILGSGTHERLAVGGRALERGIVVGRYARCSGDTAEMSDDVSRVHAVLLRFDGEDHLIDTGSTNGTWLGSEEIKCCVVEPGREYRLGRMHARWEPVH